MAVRSRWRVDEKTGEVVEKPVDRESDDEVDREAARKRREREERDAHPGTYL